MTNNTKRLPASFISAVPVTTSHALSHSPSSHSPFLCSPVVLPFANRFPTTSSKRPTLIKACTHRPVSTSTVHSATSSAVSLPSRDRKPQSLILPAVYLGRGRARGDDVTLLRVLVDIGMNGVQKEVLIKICHLEKSNLQLSSLADDVLTPDTAIILEFEHGVPQFSQVVRGAYSAYVWKKVNDAKYIDVGEELLMLKSAVYTGGAFLINTDRAYRAYGHGTRTESKEKKMKEEEYNYWRLQYVDQTVKHYVTDFTSLVKMTPGTAITLYLKVSDVVETDTGVILQAGGGGGMNMNIIVGVPDIDLSYATLWKESYVFISGYKVNTDQKENENAIAFATGSDTCVSIAPVMCARRVEDLSKEEAANINDICQNIAVDKKRKVILKSILPKPSSKEKNRCEKVVISGTRSAVAAAKLRDESGGSMKLSVEDGNESSQGGEGEENVEEWVIDVKKGGFNLNDCGDTIYVMDQDQHVLDVKTYHPWDVREGEWIHFE